MAVPDSEEQRGAAKHGTQTGLEWGVWVRDGEILVQPFKIPYSLISLFCNVKMRKSFS